MQTEIRMKYFISLCSAFVWMWKCVNGRYSLSFEKGWKALSFPTIRFPFRTVRVSFIQYKCIEWYNITRTPYAQWKEKKFVPVPAPVLMRETMNSMTRERWSGWTEKWERFMCWNYSQLIINHYFAKILCVTQNGWNRRGGTTQGQSRRRDGWNTQTNNAKWSPCRLARGNHIFSPTDAAMPIHFPPNDVVVHQSGHESETVCSHMNLEMVWRSPLPTQWKCKCRAIFTSLKKELSVLVRSKHSPRSSANRNVTVAEIIENSIFTRRKKSYFWLIAFWLS